MCSNNSLDHRSDRGGSIDQIEEAPLDQATENMEEYASHEYPREKHNMII